MAKRMSVKQAEKELKENEIVDQMNTRIQRGVFNCFGQNVNREMFCDSTVEVEGVKFHCHRFVLNACSGYFAAMLRSDKRGRLTLNATLQGISSNIFKLILDAIYTGSIAMTRGNMLEMWNAANQLQIEFLMSECEDFVLKNINSENYDAVYCYAVLFKSVKVISHTLKYRVEKFFYFANSGNLYKLQYKELLQILQRTNLPVCVDFQVEAILKWCGTQNDNEETKGQGDTDSSQNIGHLADLLQAVDLSKVSRQCLVGLVKNPFDHRNSQAIAIVNTHATTGLCSPRKSTLSVRFASGGLPGDDAFRGNSVCPHCQPWLVDSSEN